MCLKKIKKQKSPLAFSLESRLNALENKPRTIHRLEKLEPSSPWVLHEGDTAPAVLSPSCQSQSLFFCFSGDVGRAEQTGCR